MKITMKPKPNRKSAFILLALISSLGVAQANPYYWAPGESLGGDGNLDSANWSTNSDGSGSLVNFTASNSTTLHLSGSGGVVTSTAYNPWGTLNVDVNGYTLNPTFNFANSEGAGSNMFLAEGVTLNLFTNTATGMITDVQSVTGGAGSKLQMNMGSGDLTKTIQILRGTISVPLDIAGTNGTAIIQGRGGNASQGTISGAISVNDGITLRLATNGNNYLNMNSAISGNINVELNSAGTSNGIYWNNTGATYTGTTTMRSGNASHVVHLGNDNVMPTGTDLIFGTGTAANGGRLNLNGNDQTVASLSSADQAIGSIITSTGTSTLTIDGASEDSFDLVIGGGAGTLNLVRDGSGTTTLTAANTYTGTTTVSGTSTLIIQGDQSAAVGLTTVEAGAAIGGGGTLGGSLHFADGARLLFGDTLAVDGAEVTFGGFSVENLLGLDYLNVAEGTYTLISGAATIVFSNLANVGIENAYDLGEGRLAYFQEGSLQLVVVPEPHTYALIFGFGCLTFVMVRRRKNT